MVSVYLMKTRVFILLSTRILIKTMPRKFHWLCDSPKNCFFHNGHRDMFEYTSPGNASFFSVIAHDIKSFAIACIVVFLFAFALFFCFVFFTFSISLHFFFFFLSLVFLGGLTEFFFLYLMDCCMMWSVSLDTLEKGFRTNVLLIVIWDKCGHYLLLFCLSLLSVILDGLPGIFFINDSKIVSEDIRDQYRSKFIRYSKKGSVTYVLEVCLCHACNRWFTMCLRLFMVTTTCSIQKVIRNRNLETRWKITQMMIQLLKAQKREKSSW